MALIRIRFFGAYKIEESYSKDNPGILDGECRFYYIDGQIMVQEFYTDGKLNGERKVLYENGLIKEINSYRNGDQEGEHNIWHENKQLAVKDFSRDGARQGELKIWNTKGIMTEYSYWINGRYANKTFTWKKKCTFLNLKNRLYFRKLSTIDIPIISDLLKLASSHC